MIETKNYIRCQPHTLVIFLIIVFFLLSQSKSNPHLYILKNQSGHTPILINP